MNTRAHQVSDAVSAQAAERYDMLLQACEQAISVISHGFEQTDLQRFFPHLADNPALVAKTAQQSSQFWADNASKAISDEIARLDIHEKLELLLQLEQEARDRRDRCKEGSVDPRDQPVAPSDLTPQQLMELRLQPQKREYLAALRSRLAAAKAERAELEAEAQTKLAQLSTAVQALK